MNASNTPPSRNFFFRREEIIVGVLFSILNAAAAALIGLNRALAIFTTVVTLLVAMVLLFNRKFHRPNDPQESQTVVGRYKSRRRVRRSSHARTPRRIFLGFLGIVALSAGGYRFWAGSSQRSVRGRLSGFHFNPESVPPVVVAWENEETSTAFALIDANGEFDFPSLRRTKYRFTTFFQTGPETFEVFSFDRNLASEMDSPKGPLFVEQYRPKKYTGVVAKCFFASGDAELDVAARNALESLLQKCREKRYMRLVFGHADSQGGRQRNIKLSVDRCKSVMTWLTRECPEAGNFVAAAFGSDRPSVEGNYAEALNANRRVEIFFLSEITSASIG